MDAEAQALFNAALTKLPQFDPNWPEPVRAGWWRCFNALRDLGEAMVAHGVPAQLSMDASARTPAEALAECFHEAYERLAPSFGYTTRPETRALDLQSANGRLMVAVCQELLAVPLHITLLTRLRERCAEVAESMPSDYQGSARDTAEEIRAIELDEGVR